MSRVYLLSFISKKFHRSTSVVSLNYISYFSFSSYIECFIMSREGRVYRLIVVFVVMFLLFVNHVTPDEDDEVTIIPSGYQQHTPPENANITFTLTPLSLLEVETRTSDLKVEIILKLDWQDARLEQPDTGNHEWELPAEEYNKIWRPDIKFNNCRICTEEILERIPENGLVVYNSDYQKITIAIRSVYIFICDFDFSAFPFDFHLCFVEVTTYGDHQPELMVVPAIKIHASQIRCPPDYKIIFYYTNNEIIEKNKGRIRFFIKLCHVSSQMIFLLYIPSSLFILVSWIPFWVNPEYGEMKISISLTMLLTIATQLDAVQHKLEGVTSVKALDIWMLFCVLMLVGSMSYSAISVMFPEAVGRKTNENDVYFFRKKKFPPNKRFVFKPLTMPSIKHRPSYLDICCRALFPFVFVIFIISYWWSYYRPC